MGCRDVIQRLLEKNEEMRPTAEMVVSHQWVAQVVALEGASEAASNDQEQTANLRESAVNIGIYERRQELINPLNVEQRSVGGTLHTLTELPSFMKETFVLPSMHSPSVQMKYEWGDPSQVEDT